MSAVASVHPLGMHGTIDPARRLDEAATMLALSFRDAPNFVDIWPVVSDRARALAHVFTALCQDAFRHGRIDVARLDGDFAVGVAVWFPPEAHPISAGRKAKLAPHLMRSVLAAPRATVPLLRLNTALAAWRPDVPHTYLAAVGVAEPLRGNGLATRLLAPGLADADARNLPCYLEAQRPSTVAWYERLGFHTQGGPRRITPTGSPNWTMMRPARRQ